MTVPTSSPRATKVRLIRGTDKDLESGLLGFVSLVWDDMWSMDCLALRRTADGRLALTFPARTDKAGRRHPYYRPIDSASREIIETEVFRGLRGDFQP